MSRLGRRFPVTPLVNTSKLSAPAPSFDPSGNNSFKLPTIVPVVPPLKTFTFS